MRNPRWPPRQFHGLWAAAILPLGLAGTLQGAEPFPPSPSPAALVVHPRRLESQPAATHALVLPWVLRGFQSYAACAKVVDDYAVLALEASGEKTTIAVARGKADLRPFFERLQSRRAPDIAGREATTLRRSPLQAVLVGSGEIAEGSPAALERYLASGKGVPDRERQLLAATLRTGAAVPAAATLFHIAEEGEASFDRILQDFDAIWPGLSRLAEPYAVPLKLLGAMRAGRADVWQEGDSLRVRVLLVSGGSMDAKRSLLALRTARGLAPMASDAAVRAGTLTPRDAELLAQILESMRSRREEERIYVDLAVTTAAILPAR